MLKAENKVEIKANKTVLKTDTAVTLSEPLYATLASSKCKWQELSATD